MSKLFYLQQPDYVKADVEAEQSRIRKLNSVFQAAAVIELHLEELDTFEFHQLRSMLLGTMHDKSPDEKSNVANCVRLAKFFDEKFWEGFDAGL